MVVFVPGLVGAQPVVAGGGVSPIIIQAIEQDILALRAAGYDDQQIFAYLLNKYGNVGFGYGGTGYGSYGTYGYGGLSYGTNGYGYGYPYRRFALGYPYGGYGGLGYGGYGSGGGIVGRGGRGVGRVSPQQLRNVYRNFTNNHPRNRINSPSIRQKAVGRNNRQNAGISQRNVKAQAGRHNHLKAGKSRSRPHP